MSNRVLCLLVLISYNIAYAEVKVKNLWGMVAEVMNERSFTRTGIEKIMGVHFKEESKTDAQISFSSSGPALDNIRIDKVNLRNSSIATRSGILVLDISGSCVPLSEVKAQYPQLKITQAPRGGSLDDETVFTSVSAWGEISFGFKEKNRDCLAAIIFEPKDNI